MPMRYIAPLFAALLVGCTAYRAAPLPVTARLAANPAALAHGATDAREIDTSRPLSLQDIAALAVFNNPDLKAARAQHDISAAQLTAAGMPPDPSITGGFAALLGGAGTMPAISGGFTQDIGALITYKADRQAASAGLKQVDAGILWQEWQTASQAEQLAATLCADQAMLASLQDDDAMLSTIDQATQAAIAQNNQTLDNGATSMAALAAVQSNLATARLSAAHDLDALDALLALQTGTAIAITSSQVQAPPPDLLAQALASLGQRRPDLIALRFGYDQADARLRAAILTQFLPLSIGANGGRDTTGVDSAGPQITLTLPLFNRNRSAIKGAQATRAMLAAQYEAALDAASSGMHSLAADIALLQPETAQAQSAAAQAATIAASARSAFANGQINALAMANLQVAAGERQRSYLSLRNQLQSAEISLATLLGLGLPAAQESLSS